MEHTKEPIKKHKYFINVLRENQQAQIAAYYNIDKTDEERKIRNAVIEEYRDLILIMKDRKEEFLSNSELEELRETVKELREALDRLVHLHLCEQEGLISGRPSAEQWLTAVDNASDALTRSKHLS